MATPALYMPNQTVVDVIQDGEEMAFVKFPGGKAIWVKSGDLDFDDPGIGRHQDNLSRYHPDDDEFLMDEM